MSYDDGSNPLATQADYRYDALGRRIQYKRYDESGTLLEEIRYVHDGQNVLADYAYDAGSQTERIARVYVNGSQYIDERVVMRDYTDTQNPPKDRYYLQQELYSVAGLADANAALLEMAVYDTYGDAKLYAWPFGDVDRTGTTESGTDGQTVQAANGTATPWYDVNFDGTVNLTDTAAVNSHNTETAQLANYSGLGNPYLFTGRLTDTLHADSWYASTDPTIMRLQDNNHRTYLPKHGRWLQRDPLGLVPTPQDASLDALASLAEGSNPYMYVRSRPLVGVDPHGMEYWDGPNFDYNVCCHWESYQRSTLTIRDDQGYDRWQEGRKLCHTQQSLRCACLLDRREFNNPNMAHRKLLKATHGKCCSCKVERRQQLAEFQGIHRPTDIIGAPGAWLFPHAILMVRCTDGTGWYADHPHPSSAYLPSASTVIESQYPDITDTWCISCDAAKSLRERADSLRGASYDGIQDCYWYVRKVIEGLDSQERSLGCDEVK